MGRFWEPGYGLVRLADAAAFRAYDTPGVAKMLLASERWRCSEEALTVAAMLDAGNAVSFTR